MYHRIRHTDCPGGSCSSLFRHISHCRRPFCGSWNPVGVVAVQQPSVRQAHYCISNPDNGLQPLRHYIAICEYPSLLSLSNIFPPCTIQLTCPFQLYPSSDAPRYIMGYSVSIAFLGYGVIIYSFLSLYYRHVNIRRRAGKEDHKISGMSDAEIEALGDRSPRFIYTI